MQAVLRGTAYGKRLDCGIGMIDKAAASGERSTRYARDRRSAGS